MVFLGFAPEQECGRKPACPDAKNTSPLPH